MADAQFVDLLCTCAILLSATGIKYAISNCVDEECYKNILQPLGMILFLETSLLEGMTSWPYSMCLILWRLLYIVMTSSFAHLWKILTALAHACWFGPSSRLCQFGQIRLQV